MVIRCRSRSLPFSNSPLSLNHCPHSLVLFCISSSSFPLPRFRYFFRFACICLTFFVAAEVVRRRGLCAASCEPPRVSPATASPSFHHRDILLGPGELFTRRTSPLITAHSDSVIHPARLLSRPLGSTASEPLPPSHRSRVSLPPLVRADGALLVSRPRAPVALANMRL